jgi:uncharacterized protein (DUF4415 family)
MQKGDGLMSTIKDDNFDYQNYVKKNSPVTTEVKRGTNARRQRLETAIKRFTIRIDEDILEQFQQLVPQGQGYERLINQALREWLSARGIKELVREELQDIVHQALTTTAVEAKLQKKSKEQRSTVAKKKQEKEQSQL